MSVDVRVRHDRLLREQAVEMFERGCGYGLTARRLGVSAETVREWQKTYRVIGRDGLVAMGVKQTRYDYETKVAAVRAVVDGGMSKPEAMVRFGIVSATPLKQWCRLYREGGAQALRPKPKGRPKGSVRAVPPTREEELWGCAQVVDGLFMRLLSRPLGVVRIRWGICRPGWCGCGGGCRSLRSRWRPRCRPGRGW